MQILNRTEYSDRLSFPGEQLANVFFNNFFKSTNRKVKTNGRSFMSGCLLKRRGVFSSANASWKFIFQFNIRNISFNMELLGYGSRPFPFHPFPVPWGFHAILLRFCVQNLLQPISHVTLRKKYRQLFWYELDRGVLWQQRVLRLYYQSADWIFFSEEQLTNILVFQTILMAVFQIHKSKDENEWSISRQVYRSEEAFFCSSASTTPHHKFKFLIVYSFLLPLPVPTFNSGKLWRKMLSMPCCIPVPN